MAKNFLYSIVRIQYITHTTHPIGTVYAIGKTSCQQAISKVLGEAGYTQVFHLTGAGASSSPPCCSRSSVLSSSFYRGNQSTKC